MNEKKRYKFFKLILILTIINIFGILFYENVLNGNLFKKKPEFYVETINNKKGSAVSEVKSVKVDTIERPENNATSKQVKEKKKEKRGKNILIIGDSNIYLMSRNKEEYIKEYGDIIFWLSEAGVTTDFISDDIKVSLGHSKPEYMENSLTKTYEISLLKEIENNDIGEVVVMLGVNSLLEEKAKELSTKLKLILKSSEAGVSFVSVMPYINKSRYKILPKDVINFNALMKKELKESGVNYVDAYGLVSGLEGYKNETTDGLHYSKEIYNKVLAKIMEVLVQNN